MDVIKHSTDYSHMRRLQITVQISPTNCQNGQKLNKINFITTLSEKRMPIELILLIHEIELDI